MSDYNDGPKRLWCAVILQAINDAVSPNCERNQRAIVRDTARAWLLIPNDDFAFACTCADLDLVRVREYAKDVISKGECNINTLRLQRERKHRAPRQRRAGGWVRTFA